MNAITPMRGGGTRVLEEAELLRAVSTHHAEGLSNRAIGRAIGVGHHVIAGRLKELGLSPNSTRHMSAPERFWRFVDRSGDCWVWTGHRAPGGYGNLKVGRRQVRANRYSFMLATGRSDLRRDEFICHRCDNPPCVRPEHLFLGTAADNTGDMIAKGRARGISTDPRANQRKGAATRTRRAMEVVLPQVLAAVRERSNSGRLPRQRECMDIPGYCGILRRFRHAEILEMAACSA
jgi:hypothetical protein